jgi:hypothetical protein
MEECHFSLTGHGPIINFEEPGREVKQIMQDFIH